MKTETQLRNIERLADYLDRLPENYPHFDMEDWFHPADHLPYDNERQEILASQELINPRIGSCGCALGHSAAAGVDITNWHSWNSLAHEAYGVIGDEFMYVFGGYQPSDPKAAAERLRELLPVYA